MELNREIKGAVAQQLDNQLENLMAYINIVRSDDPAKGSADIKEEFIRDCEEFDAKAGKFATSWRSTGFKQDAFETFWEIAWQRAAERN